MRKQMQFLGLIVIGFLITVGCNSISDSNSTNTNQIETSSINNSNSTVVPGHKDRYDKNNNGYPDEGEVVTGKYTVESGDCTAQVQYRGAFDDDPYLDSGWIINNWQCPGGAYNYLFVHETDRRYTGNPDWAIWGTWEWHILTVPGSGNLVRPENHVGS